MHVKHYCHKKASILLLVLMLFGYGAIPALQAQGGNAMGINFSALVRDSTGRAQPLIPVQIRFTILTGQTGTAGNAPWVEIQKTTTDAFGFVNATIGTGVQAGGTAAGFAGVDFSQGNYWLLAEVFNNKTLTYQPLAKQALQAVAYAKTAGAAGTQAIPPGTIVAFAGDFNHVPAGWVECQGQQLDNRVVANVPLFNTIGYTWGGEGNVFRLPGSNDLFLRGATNGKPGDPDAASRQPSGNLPATSAGSSQQTVIQMHLHGLMTGFKLVTGQYPINQIPGNFNVPQPESAYPTFGYAVSALPNSQTPRVSNTDSHPVNVLVNYIIKL